MILFITLNAGNIHKIKNNDEKIENTTISFGESFSYKLEENIGWRIIDTKNFSLLYSGFGSISNVIFSTPGTYEVEIIDPASSDVTSCRHDLFPHKIVVLVSPNKMIFDFNTIKFNNEVIGGQLQSGNEISIDVYFENYNNDQVFFNNGKIITAGVGVNIDGYLTSDNQPLKKGVNHLVYKINGQATSQTYIMFNFYDVNNNIVSYTYPNIIK